MLAYSKLPVSFWSEVVASACYTLKCFLTVKKNGKTCFKLLNKRKPTLKWLEPFGSQCTVLDPNCKFGSKSVEGFFVGYASPIRRIFLPSINCIVQIQHVDCQRYATPIQRKVYQENGEQEVPIINEDPILVYDTHLDDTPATPTIDDDGEDLTDVTESLIQPTPDPVIFYPVVTTPVLSDEVITNENVTNPPADVIAPGEVLPRTISYHQEDNIIGDLNTGVRTRRQLDEGLSCYYSQVSPLQNRFSFKCFISLIEPKTYKKVLTEESWVNAMQEELLQFERLGVWKLVDLPEGERCINTKWVFKCKQGENGTIARNNARLVVLGYNQREGIDFNEVYALIARLEAIRIFLAFASWKGFKVYQLDVKSAFLKGKLGKEVFVGQPLGFVDPIFKDKVCLLNKALCGLHQAPRAWHDTLSQHLLDKGFLRGTMDCTLFTKEVDGHLLIVQVYVEDIIFGSTNDALCRDFVEVMKLKFEMSAIGELKFFLGLQVKQESDGIYIH
ncbi:uncharacterized protein LOC143600374 [Bidens hawaiensis]|uniref:uncharacterized protein LOC143600374 n=1 Tax=Bidens hawaiensis TaxID=980011 RepID=UPI00404A9B8B